jgi:hypothetical protein
MERQESFKERAQNPANTVIYRGSRDISRRKQKRRKPQRHKEHKEIFFRDFFQGFFFGMVISPPFLRQLIVKEKIVI